MLWRSCDLYSGMLRPQEAIAALQHHLDHRSEMDNKSNYMYSHFRLHSHALVGTHLCLFSVTLSSSQTSLECGERTSWTSHSSRTAMARSGPAVRASMRVRLSGLIFPSQSADPFVQLLPLTQLTCSDRATLQYCWDSWINSFHSSSVWSSTPGTSVMNLRLR